MTLCALLILQFIICEIKRILRGSGKSPHFDLSSSSIILCSLICISYQFLFSEISPSWGRYLLKCKTLITKLSLSIFLHP